MSVTVCTQDGRSRLSSSVGNRPPAWSGATASTRSLSMSDAYTDDEDPTAGNGADEEAPSQSMENLVKPYNIQTMYTTLQGFFDSQSFWDQDGDDGLNANRESKVGGAPANRPAIMRTRRSVCKASASASAWEWEWECEREV